MAKRRYRLASWLRTTLVESGIVEADVGEEVRCVIWR